MIHYALDHQALIDAINQELGSQAKQDSWWRRAHADFQRAVQERRFEKTHAYWSEIKGAFIELQHHKCAYCERPMAQGPNRAIDYDVEHHRPKSQTQAWPDAATVQRLKITYQVGQGRARGYPELAHQPSNYAVACKVCNSPLKADHFPLLGQAHQDSYDIAELNRVEQPAIPLPLGDWGEDPSGFLDFEGFVAVAGSADPAQRLRAQVVIDFFELNLRPDLLLGRAQAIALLHEHLRETQQPVLAHDVAQAQAWLQADLADSAPYAAAARAFAKLNGRNPARAREVARLAHQYLASKGACAR